MKKDLSYLECLKCGRKIYADVIKYQENNTIVVCPYKDCRARIKVRFIGGNGKPIDIKFIGLDEN